ncbi:hypothetical protein [Amycolatopsis rubida]|uniref:hypothetical protein n=1 Tax=Amycolatopsis rubida TaxID=112413 RepID=UPI001FCB0D4C|nr:hypothetical protein [Amycolatopsis rubida]
MITRCAIVVHVGVTRGVSCCVCVSLPGSMRSGLDAMKMSCPTRKPRAVNGFTSRHPDVPT